VREHIHQLVAGKSARQIIQDYRVGVESEKLRGGDPRVNAFIKEHYPELSGKRLGLDDLTDEQRAEFDAWMAERPKLSPLEFQKLRAHECWEKLAQDAYDLMGKGSIGLLPRERRQHLYEVLTQVRTHVAAALKE
jgi:hypothetical protein